jgi:ribosome biogenesis GTPase
VPVTIVLGKADTLTGEHEAEAEEFMAIYQDAGYDLIRLSSTTGEGIDQIRELLKGHTTLIAGNSGVGKSTLVSTIDPELDIRTGEISESHHKGKHTTTFSTMYRIEEGYIIDTPGIKGFGLIDIDSKELCRYFPEMMRLAPDCRFYNCTHTHEPGCAVQEGVKQGIVAWSRYESYLKILDEDDKYRK